MKSKYSSRWQILLIPFFSVYHSVVFAITCQCADSGTDSDSITELQFLVCRHRLALDNLCFYSCFFVCPETIVFEADLCFTAESVDVSFVYFSSRSPLADRREILHSD